MLTEQREWPVTGRPRRAGVSSFGISGTNAHVILEQAPADEPVEDDPDAGQGAPLAPAPLPLSAKSPEALRAQAQRLLDRIAAGGTETRPPDVAYALATTRAVFEHRAVVLGADEGEVRDALAALAEGRPAPGLIQGVADRDGKLAFLFTGQGSQQPGMGRELYAAHPAFARALDAVCAAMDGRLNRPLREVMFAEDGTDDALLLNETQYTQAGLFAHEVALFRLLESWGVRPDHLMGHSIGELAAAHVAGVLSLDDAAALVAARGRLMQDLPRGGAMVSVLAAEEEVTGLLEGHEDEVSVAAVNGPGSVVVSGDEETVLRIAGELAARGVKTRRLNVSHAFHSPRMAPMLDEFRAVAGKLAFSPPRLPIVSNVTGRLLTAEEAQSPDYWADHVRRAVRFHDGVRALRAEGVTTYLELGPDAVLTAMAQDSLTETDPGADPEGDGPPQPLLIAAQRRTRPQAATLAAAVAEAHAYGAVRLDWPALLGGSAAHRAELPTYPFQRRRYWLDNPSTIPGAAGPDEGPDDEFWSAVRERDLAALADTLGVASDGALAELLPALASWREDSARRSATDSWRYRTAWWPAAPAADQALTGTWLVVVPAALAGDAHVTAVEAALAERGARVVRTVVDPAAGQTALVTQLTEALDGTPADGVLSLLALDTAPHPDHPAVPRGTTATLSLLQALADSTPADAAAGPARLWLLTRGAVSTGGSDTLDDPAQAQVWALGRTAALEHPQLWGGLVDLPADLNDTVLRRLTALLADPAGEDQSAVRASGTFVRRLVRAAAARPSGAHRTLWPSGAHRTPSGTVLVTDGTWGMGARVARRLAAQGADHLTLTHAPGARPQETERTVADLSALGAHVTVAACDLADRAAVAALLADIPADRPLTAVFHTAGELRTAALADTDPAEFAATVAAKAAGATHLHELTDGGTLDAFVMFSSIAGVWGSAGQGAYSAANAHLDALAEHRRGRGQAAVSFAWGVWADTAPTAGEPADPAAEQARRERLRGIGLAEMDPELALTAMEGVLGGPADGPYVVADVDWARFAPAFTATRPSPFLGGVPEAEQAMTEAAGDGGEGAAEAAGTLLQSLAGLTDAEQERLLTDLVRGEIAAVLGHSGPESIGAGRALKDLGLDSLAAVALRNRLGAATGLRLSATLVFDHPSPAAVAAHLRASLGPAEPDTSPLDEELDKLQALLAGFTGDQAARDRAGARLQSLLSALTGPAPASEAATVAAQLDDATDEDIFAFIDGELGTL
ncbi:SDR family NAD(P)-dependent oxidoreductase [Streptomyces sp.]|uniref:SDR family NAD(P)-dependent oxidoreductase n=1 Tax=Streptomyces sp. TaxID=1931 RepID=UPI002F3FE6CA